MSQRYYDILGVTKNSSILEMKEAYERLCKEYEPSDHQFDPEYVKRYNEVQEAFDWLKNNHMWKINVEEESNDETAPPQQPDKQEKLINLRYVLLAALLISSVVCYLFVSPYLGSGSSQNVVVSQDRNTLELNRAGMNDNYRKLYDAVSESLDIGDYDSFMSKMNSPDSRKRFYNAVSEAGFDLGDYDEYESRLSESQPQDRKTALVSRDGIDMQLLKDYVATANYPKYNLNWDVINSKFPELRNIDRHLLKVYVATANNPDYYGNWDIINSKFPEFFQPQDLNASEDNRLLSVDEFAVTNSKVSPNTTTTLSHGGNPYGYCYTASKSCSSYCSEIKVDANKSVGTIVIIKQKGEVVSCAYIDKGRSFAFKLPNGTYEPYFYSGTGWSNKKYMKTTTQCGRLYGGFTVSESVGKDTPQTLNNQILTYDLNTQYDGNFQTKSSDVSEAF